MEILFGITNFIRNKTNLHGVSDKTLIKKRTLFGVKSITVMYLCIRSDICLDYAKFYEIFLQSAVISNSLFHYSCSSTFISVKIVPFTIFNLTLPSLLFIIRILSVTRFTFNVNNVCYGCGISEVIGVFIAHALLTVYYT
ncbi:hypothetical protein K501DRAFT_277951 [Backusella circina FSU 941]|nr:hypothetical protein K501DRAFT_277951 [Backusella circina FSU 941]